MWHPKQLLHKRVIDGLLIGEFTPLQIEFLGWLSGTASALNNSRNPVKAAHTILAKASDPDEKQHRMLALFTNRKLESIAPAETAPHVEADKVFDNLQEEINSAITIAQMTAAGYEDFTGGGISDGEGSLTSDGEEDPDAVVPETKDEDEVVQ